MARYQHATKHYQTWTVRINQWVYCLLKLIYLRQYYSYSVDQKLKMSEMIMAIFLVYSTSGLTSGKKVCRELKMAAILKILKY